MQTFLTSPAALDKQHSNAERSVARAKEGIAKQAYRALAQTG